MCAPLSVPRPPCQYVGLNFFQGWISHHLSILCGAAHHPGDLSLRACFYHMSLLSDQLCQDIWEKMTKSSWKTRSEFQRRSAKAVFANNSASASMQVLYAVMNRLYLSWQNDPDDVTALYCLEFTDFLIGQEAQIWCVFRKTQGTFMEEL